MSRLKDIPELARDGSNLNAVMASVREAIQTFRGYRGNPLDQALTLRNATDVGLLNADGTPAATGGGTVVTGPPGPPGESGVVTPDLTAPPTATGLVVTAGLSHLYIECASPVYPQGHGHDRTVVYGAKWPTGDVEPTFTGAVELVQYQGTFGAYPSPTGTRWKIWIKWRSNDGVLSVAPAGGTNGVEATTGLVTGTAIENATIGDAKIANLSAAKLTVGDGTVGGNLKSSNFNSGVAGWLIQPGGNAEFNEVVVRGTIFAAAGLIGGSTIGSNYMRSTSYALGMTGWNLQSDGTGQIGGFAVLNDAIQSANYVAGTAGWRLRQDGTLEMNTGTFRGALAAASGTFAGSLSAATGTFSGSLTADAVNAVTTINLAGNSVTVPVGTSATNQLGPYSSAGFTFVTVLSAVITTLGEPVQFIGSCLIQANNLFMRLTRNGVNLSDNGTPSSGGTIAGVLTFGVTDYPGAGTHTYAVQVGYGGVGNTYVYQRFISLLGIRR